MKRIFLCFAAVAAFASCVKENTLAPEQVTDGLLTIKAVTADTKTVLGDDAAVVWENEDAIKVVLKGTAGVHEAEFTTTLDENSTKADFTGTLDDEVTADAYGAEGFAVYPSTVTVEEISGRSRIEFVVDDVQDGKFQTSENLSYATVSLEDLKENGEVNAQFNNALSLVKVTVPSGVKSITLTSVKLLETDEITPLAGKAPFFYEEGVLEIDPSKWGENEQVKNPDTQEWEWKPLKHYSLVLKNGDDSDLAAGDHYLHVFPGAHANLTISVAGSDFTYEKTIGQAFEFKASEYHSLNMADIFGMEETEYLVSPFGGEVEVPMLTTYDDYDITVTQEGAWLEEVPVAKGAFRKEVIAFSAGPNTSAAKRTATVTVTDGAAEPKTLATFTITQKNYVAELLNDFVESYTENHSAYTGTLTIEETDDASQGVYKVTICEETVYADYEEGVLKLHDGEDDRSLTVSNDFKKISVSSLSLAERTISNYTALLSLGAPEYTDEEEALLGKYTERWTYKSAVNERPKGGMTIEASEDLAYGMYKVKFLNNGSEAVYTGYATLEDDKLTIPVGKQRHLTFNNPGFVELLDVVLTVNNDGTLTFDSWTSLDGDVTAYSATKVVVTPPSDSGEATIAGTWTQTLTVDNGTASATVTVDVDGDQVTLTDFIYKGTVVTGTLSGNTITVAAGTQISNMTGPLDANLVLTLSGDKLSMTAPDFTIGGWVHVNGYSAVKQ